MKRLLLALSGLLDVLLERLARRMDAWAAAVRDPSLRDPAHAALEAADKALGDGGYAHRGQLEPDELNTALSIRRRVDQEHPRATDSGGVNASHVAAELTLRERAGLPGYIAFLDGPGFKAYELPSDVRPKS